jgi:hypothetical protein
MPHDTTEDDRQEAARLRLLPVADQIAIVELIGSPASNPKVPKADRQEAARRARVLARLLKLPTPKRRK